ncbi:TetR/AcrR family transcriptional regulator [Acholeplasma equifetale]|uniref:TetR/AcrR family transcriptional regulator n=1 Tax=Acholeplasma equifetale TaxID=264634 RepID=UPI00138AEBEB|nr:TetR/AcrR family transcriptional regulator [Acholeplasma equifetale]
MEHRKIILTKRQIRMALVELLERYNMNEISVTKLCEVADVNRTTFYRYYRNVVDVYEELENSIIHELDKTLETLIVEIPLNQAEAFIKELFDQIKNNFSDFKILFKDKFFIVFQNKVVEMIYRYNNLLLSSTDPLFNEKFNYMVYGSIELVKKWLFGEIHKTSAELAKIIVEFASPIITLKIKK